MDWMIKKNGRVFRCIKFRPFSGMEHFKPESNTSEGDLFVECNDGWFKNRSTEGRTDILNIEGWEEFYQQVKDQLTLDAIALEHYNATLQTDPDLQEFNESLKALLQIATPKNTTFSDTGVIITYDLDSNSGLKAVEETATKKSADKFKKNKWYQSKYGALVCYKEPDVCYGFDDSGQWHDTISIWREKGDDWIEAGLATILYKLKEEAIRRKLVRGAIIEAWMPNADRLLLGKGGDHYSFCPVDKKQKHDVDGIWNANTLAIGDIGIFVKGVWAKFVESVHYDPMNDTEKFSDDPKYKSHASFTEADPLEEVFIKTKPSSENDRTQIIELINKLIDKL